MHACHGVPLRHPAAGRVPEAAGQASSPACSFDVPWTFSKCDFDDFNGWADAVDQKLIASGLDLSKYFHRRGSGPCHPRQRLPGAWRLSVLLPAATL